MKDKIKKKRNVSFIIGKCYQIKKSILMRYQKKDRNTWYHTSSVALKETLAHQDMKISNRMSGQLMSDPEYKGCPHCGSDSGALCSCGKMFCWESQNPIPANYTCPWCGINGVLEAPIENLEGSACG